MAERAGVAVVEIEVTCSDPHTHKYRVEQRPPNFPGRPPPTWRAVMAHDYQPWHRARLVIDTAETPVAACVDTILKRISAE